MLDVKSGLGHKMFLNLNRHVCNYNCELLTSVLIYTECSQSFAICPLPARGHNEQIHTAAASIDRHQRLWSCEGRWVLRVVGCFSDGVYYHWALQRTEASVSVQEHKHSAIATLPFSRFRCYVVFQPRPKPTADPQNAEVTKIHAHCFQTDMWCNPLYRRM